MLATLVVIFLSGIMAEEVSTPASLLGPRNFNPHPYITRRILKQSSPSPTRQGPVTFPNDGPPPPRTPLVVTSRPLIDAIARSDLANNTIAESSFINAVTYKPYSNRDQDYEGFAPNVPYTEMLKKIEERAFLRAGGYNEYEQRPEIPPIYNALPDERQHAPSTEKPAVHYYQPKTQDYSQEYNDVSSENENNEHHVHKNYAFSYIVKDHRTGDDFSHQQESHGAATKGEYRVRLPDGREQVVSYTADKNGYQADVKYNDDISNNYDSTNYNQGQYGTNHKSNINYNGNSDNGFDNYNVNNYNNVDQNLNNAYQTDYKVREEIPSDIAQYDSSEYYNDYSDKNFVPGSKFAVFSPSTKASYVTTVKPAYSEIKNFINKIHSTSVPNYVDESAVDVNNYDEPDAVVIIDSNRYTDVSKGVSELPNYITPPPASHQPSYSSFKDPAKSILSDSYIDRINKYLTFNKK